MEVNQKKYTPILPFDSSPRNHFTIYDNVTYIRNRDLCLNMIRKSSGNIIKYYECKPDSTPTMIQAT